MRKLINVTSLIESLTILNKNYHSDAQMLCSKFINYEIPIVTIKNRTKEEVGLIFERINNTGTKLGTLDLMTAWTWTDEFHLQEKSIELFESLEKKGFGKLNKNIFMQSMSGYIQDDATTKAIVELDGKTIRDNWEGYCNSLKKAIDFLSTELHCKNIDFLPYQQQIAGLTKFFSISGKPTGEEYTILKKWFWRSSFSNRYSSGTTTDKINSDIKFMNSLRTGDKSIQVDSFKMTILDSDIIKTNFSKANPLTRALLLLMSQFNPKDLVTNINIDLDKALSTYNRKEFHHVFPNAFLKAQGIEKKDIFSLVNFCFLPSDSNKKISNNSPSTYFFNLILQNEFNNILESNLLPLEKSIYQNDDYPLFQIRRAELIINEIKNRI